jgi:hypothetical protein
MHFGRALCRFIIAAGITASPPAGAATSDPTSSGDVIMVQATPAVIHFHYDPAHVKYSWLVGAEWQRPSGWLAGYTYFNNSFGQKSQYIYGGKWWPMSESGQGWYFKLTGGAVLGYKEPYEDKLPFNHNGVAPGIVPGLGFKMNRANVQLNLLGINALMITFGCDLIRW